MQKKNIGAIKKSMPREFSRGIDFSKTVLRVTAEHDESGQVRPLFLTWTDGGECKIDRATDVRQAPSLRGGWLGMRYTVRVRGKEVYLFEDEGRWLVEG